MPVSNPGVGSSVTTAEIEDGQITTDKLAAGAVTKEKTTGIQPDPKQLVMTLETDETNYTNPTNAIASSSKGSGSPIETSDGGTANPLGFGTGTSWSHRLTGVSTAKPITSVSLNFSVNNVGKIKIAIYDDNGAGAPDNRLGVEEFTIQAGTGEQAFQFTTPITPTAEMFIVVAFETSGKTTLGDLVGSERHSVAYASAHPDPFVTSSTSGNGFWIKMIQDTVQSPGNSIDDDEGTYWESDSEIGASIYADMNAVGNYGNLVIYPHANSSLTEFIIESSTDAVTWEKLRTVLWSAITEAGYNYITIPVRAARYFRIKSNDAGAATLAIAVMKLKGMTDSELLVDHTHKEILNTDTSLTLGVA